MKLNLRIFLSLSITIGIIFYFYFDFIKDDIRRKYKEAVEESLNDTVNLMASIIETEITDDGFHFNKLRQAFSRASRRTFSAKIYELSKTKMDLDIYVVDKNGLVIFDSNNGILEGEDYSQWNDVYLTLKGRYGARSTRDHTDDPATDALYIAAPIQYKSELIGAVTVKKPKNNINKFTEISRKKIISASILSFAGIFLLVTIISFWTTRPITRLLNYVRSLKTKTPIKFPRLGKTEIRELALAFEDIREKLEGKKYIEKYIQTLTHEIKSPLSSIRAAAELLEEDMPVAQRLKFFKNIQTESMRIENLISHMLELAALENRRAIKEKTMINLSDLFNEITESFTPSLEQKEISIIKDIDKSLFVKGEKFLLRHSIANLFENAIKFTQSHQGIIEIIARDDGTQTIITIKDNGTGIPDYAGDKIFDRFYSLPPTKKAKKSTGLGLSFVKEVAKLHEGDITICNNSEAGVSAILTIPH